MMKCRKCGGKAVVNLRQHKLALCKEHFVEWVPEQAERAIHKYRMFTPEERVLVAVSGGKDSLGLWDVLTRLGYRTEGLYINLGIGAAADSNLQPDEAAGYSATSLEKIRQFMTSRPGLKLHVVDVAATYGATIPEAARLTARGWTKPCSVCGLTKRYIMNRVAREGGYDALATGHNLDDEAAVLMSNTLSWQAGYLARQGPVLPASEDGLVRKAKPFCRAYERDTAAYAILTGIDYIYDECPHAVGATSIEYKEWLNQLESKRRGAKLQFYLNFLRAKQEGLFAGQEKRVALSACTTCGQPSSAPGECAFCRLWRQVRERKQQGVETTA
jgi:uncharacterized protein (TIGR00269 family)